MKKLNKDKRNYIILVLCAILIVMAVGYAAFAQQLTINSTAETTSTWNVRFTNIEVVAADTVGHATDKGSSYTNITDNGLTANFYAQLESPNDSITYKITVLNSGSLNAKLTLNENFPVSQDVSFTRNKNHNGLETNSVLEAGATDYIYYTVTYNSYDNQVSPGEGNNITSGSVTLNFAQTNESASSSSTVTVPDGYYLFNPISINIGDTWDMSGLTLNEFPNHKKAAIKYIVENNKVTAAYACLLYDENSEPICLKGGTEAGENPSNFFSGNQTTIANVKSRFESTIDGGSCSSNSSSVSCSSPTTASNAIKVEARPNGTVSVSETNTNDSYCNIYSNGTATCTVDAISQEG